VSRLPCYRCATEAHCGLTRQDKNRQAGLSCEALQVSFIRSNQHPLVPAMRQLPSTIRFSFIHRQEQPAFQPQCKKCLAAPQDGLYIWRRPPVHGRSLPCSYVHWV